MSERTTERMAAPLPSRVAAGLLGVAVGDALGVPVESVVRSILRLSPVTEMRGGGVWGQPAGTWSDDSSLTFCLAESLIRGFDIEDQGRWFCRWLYKNVWTPRGAAFDVGSTTREALERLRRAGKGDIPHLSEGPTRAGRAGTRRSAEMGNVPISRRLPIADRGSPTAEG